MTDTDPDALADALLDGPWQAAAMAIRLARLRGQILIRPDAEAFAAALVRRYPDPPTRTELVAHLGRPPDLLDPRYDLEQLCRLLAIDQGELAWFADRQGRVRRAPGRAAALPLARGAQARRRAARRGAQVPAQGDPAPTAAPR